MSVNIPDSNAYDLACIGENGKAPKSKVRSAQQAFAIATEYKRFDEPRRRKRTAIYKAYQGFCPTEYSRIVEEGAEWQCNVNWRQMEFRIDNQKTSFIDLLTEKNLIANIVTKFGKDTGDDLKYSDLISIGYDRMMRRWDNYLLNGEQVLQDMLLYGKGLVIWDEVEGFLDEHAEVGDFLIPDNANVDFSNVECCVRMRSMSPNQLWDKVRDLETADASEAVGWNKMAVVEALRYHLANPWTKLTTEQLFHKMAEGSVNVLSLANKKIDIYEVFVREFDNKISKHVVLQQYWPCRKKNPQTVRMKDDDYIDKTGYLFTKTGMYDSWSDLLSIFTDSAGSKKWHEIRGLADRIFVQCRSYDINMNAIMDALRLNMILMLKGDTAQATKILREVGIAPWAIIPEDMNPVAVQLRVPIQDAQAVMRQQMGDTDSGIGAYRVSNDTQGPEKTLGERQLDAADSAKLSGVQVRRYNEWQTVYHRKVFKKMTRTTSDEKDKEVKKVFTDFMKENNVPKEAYNEDNITLVESNMISGAGSPSYKLMAAKEIVGALNISPNSEGQEEALKDLIAALAGRQNVERYYSSKKSDVTQVTRTISFENAGLSYAYANPANFPVDPKDPQMEHLHGHFTAITFMMNLVPQLAQNDKLDKAAEMVKGMQNIFGHLAQHAALLEQDQTKEKTIGKQVAQGVADLKRQIDGISAQIGKILEAQSQQEGGGEKLSPEDIKLQKMQAMAQLEVWLATQKSNISLAAIAQKHQLRHQTDMDRAETKLATDQITAQQKIEQQRRDQEQSQSEET